MPLRDWDTIRRVDSILASYRRAGARVAGSPYWISFPLAGINGNLVRDTLFIQPPVVIPREADFIWLGNIANPNQFVPEEDVGPNYFANALIRIRLLQTNRSLGRHRLASSPGLEEWIPILTIAGSVKMPFLWPYPILLKGSDAIEFSTIKEGGSSDVVRTSFTMIGVQIYPVREALA